MVRYVSNISHKVREKTKIGSFDNDEQQCEHSNISTYNNGRKQEKSKETHKELLQQKLEQQLVTKIGTQTETKSSTNQRKFLTQMPKVRNESLKWYL